MLGRNKSGGKTLANARIALKSIIVTALLFFVVGPMKPFWRIRLALRRAGRTVAKLRLHPPHPWAPITIASLALIASVISATMASLNYNRSFRTAALAIASFDDHQQKLTFGNSGEKLYHQLRMHLTNYGQSTATIKSVAIIPGFSKDPLTAEQENEGMDNLVRNKAQLGLPHNTDIATGQKAFFPSNAGYPDEQWSAFTEKKEFLYVFALVTFTDERSGDRPVITEFCVRLDQGMNSWDFCTGPHNRTVRYGSNLG